MTKQTMPLSSSGDVLDGGTIDDSTDARYTEVIG